METDTTLREHPDIRFADPIQLFDLRRIADDLARESSDTPNGHNQIALYKRDLATTALFSFEKGGMLPEHSAVGTVFIQVIEGKLTVTVEGNPQRVESGQLLVLAPNIPHDVVAEIPSIMLLTVSLVEAKPEDVPAHLT